MSKKSCPGKDEGRKHSGRRDSWCPPDVLKAGEEGSLWLQCSGKGDGGPVAGQVVHSPGGREGMCVYFKHSWAPEIPGM